MMLAATLLVLTFMIVPLVLIAKMRRFGMEEAATEQALLSHTTHTVSWPVPEGEDPALVRSHLAHGGFVSVLDRSGDQRLVVQCRPADRERVREIIAHTEHTTFDGHALVSTELRFDDDPA